MKRSSRAFTLIEIVIAIGIMLVLFLAVVNFFVSSNSIFSYDKGFVDTASGAGAIVSALNDAVLPADAVLASHAFSTGTYSTGTSTLVVELPSIDSTGAVISGTNDYVAFYQTGGTAYRRIEADGASSRHTGTKILSTNVSSLAFSYNSTDMTQVTQVTADVVTQSASHGSTLTDHLTQQFYLRNHS